MNQMAIVKSRQSQLQWMQTKQMIHMSQCPWTCCWSQRSQRMKGFHYESATWMAQQSLTQFVLGAARIHTQRNGQTVCIINWDRFITAAPSAIDINDWQRNEARKWAKTAAPRQMESVRVWLCHTRRDGFKIDGTRAIQVDDECRLARDE